MREKRRGIGFETVAGMGAIVATLFCCIDTRIMHVQVQYVYMYGHQSMDQPGKVANPARCQLNKED